MFSRSAHSGPPEPAPGLREMTPQPPPQPPVQPAVLPPAPPVADESVVAKDDDLEGTVKSRGTVRVLGTLRGRIEAVRVVIEDGATVEADIVVDEAIVAGTYTGSLTCRQRLEARPTGRLSGRLETLRVMLHEGASLEGEMHMLAPSAGLDTTSVRGSIPVRPAYAGGSAKHPSGEGRPAAPTPVEGQADTSAPAAVTPRTGAAADGERQGG